ncbi:aminotransferase class I/II-fold pyridoxal phosphate-dependent enzyme [Rariglobus hedericola]|uniref:Pyridoxal phosphate-dependent aminotransferase family protein n=1 Tax=Rariglobus hedericola TaxID=2597822 RepID=A0A556QJ20_9BACT|nr:pyridoxal phosphate-dependent aminotransferase family protein [Rariglobus hedericola]TSJ76655.1 pyridoxal phosphate-dependent aminotransferase family protein [Rariglobus hedericola]
MAFSLFSSKNRNSIASRCQDDSATKLRLRYAPYYHAMQSQQGTSVRLDGRDLIMLASNDYLGLSFHPKVIEASRAALLKWGTSPTGARVSNGSRAYHVELEEKLAAFLGKEACHIHAAGYLSCLSGVAAFAQKGDAILADKNIHSCLWDGIRLSTASVERFSHNSPDDLRTVVSSLPANTPKMMVVEGVYSMEGHIAHLPGLLAIANEYECFNVLDDAHGFGVLGRQGRGTADHFGLTDKVDIICGSMSKALASTGGFVAGDRSLIEYMRTHGKHTIFSASLSPSQAAAASAALDVLQSEPEHLERLWKNQKRYIAMLQSLGLDTWGSETPAVPVVIGDKMRAYSFWQSLMEKGVFTVISVAPAVPIGKDLIRTAISAGHTDEQLDRIGEAFAYAKKRS